MNDSAQGGRDERVRHLLKLLHSAVSERGNPVLIYIVEMALAEMDDRGLDGRPSDDEKILSQK